MVEVRGAAAIPMMWWNKLKLSFSESFCLVDHFGETHSIHQIERNLKLANRKRFAASRHTDTSFIIITIIIMDNDAFRALVQERARPKSTKEIAREAVEEEFRTRKKKRKRGGGASSSESDDSDKEDTRKPQQDMLIPAAVKKKPRKEESKYRDRAKERREGKNVDYQAQASLLEGVATSTNENDGGTMDEVTISKYLGGDEEHTHLVKGLDVALARRVKREMDKETMNSDLERIEKAKANVPIREETTKTIVVVKDADEARAFLQCTSSDSVSSELGRQMLSHMKRVYLPPRKLSDVAVQKSSAGFAIQRTSLTFSTSGNPRDRTRAWELPLESMQASSQADRDVPTGMNGAISLDKTLLQHMQRAFSENSSTSERSDSKMGVKTLGNSATSGKKEQVNEEDEDDIFDDVDDYVAPTQPKSNADVNGNGGQSKVARNSIFGGLTVSKPTQERSTHSLVEKAAVSASKHKVISRDVLGTTGSRPTTTSSSTSKAQMGVSVSSYEGGYGEELDVDFDGRFAVDDDEDGDSGKKKRIKEKAQPNDDGEGWPVAFK